MRRVKTAGLGVLLLAGMALSSGCAGLAGVGWNFHFKGRPKMPPPDGYQIGAVYELRQDVFLFAPNIRRGKNEGALVPPRLSGRTPPAIHSAPDTVEAWMKKEGDMSKWDGSWYENHGIADYDHIIGVIGKGTHVEMKYMRIIRSLSIWFGYTVFETPIGIIKDGAYAGWTVDMADISFWYPEMHPDPRLLRTHETVRGVATEWRR